MPSGLVAVVNAYEGVGLELDTLARDNQAGQAIRRKRLEDARQFWVRVFLDSVAASDDTGLAVLDAEGLQAQNLRVIDDLAKRISDWEADLWFGKAGRVVRTLGAVGLACRGTRDSSEIDRDEDRVIQGQVFEACEDFAFASPEIVDDGYRAAVAYLASLVKFGPTEEDQRFAAALVFVIRMRLIHAPELINAAYDSAVSYRDTGPSTAGGRRLLGEISNYLYWAVLDSDVAEMLVPRVANEVRQFVGRARNVSLDSLGDREQYRVDRVMVRILSNVTSRSPSARRQAREVLTNLYAVGREKLIAMGFRYFVLDWERE